MRFSRGIPCGGRRLKCFCVVAGPREAGGRYLAARAGLGGSGYDAGSQWLTAPEPGMVRQRVRPTDPAVAWPVVPPEAAEFMLPELDAAAEEVISAIQRGVPEYARPHDDSYTAAVRRAVHHALRQFVQQIADPATPREGTAELFAGIGRRKDAASSHCRRHSG